MSYLPVAVYSMDGDFLGYAIKGEQFKLQSTNLYRENEGDALQQRLNDLNEDVDLRLYWPNPKDPEVLEILAHPEWMPIQYKMAEVVDDEHSTYVWEQVEEVYPDTGVPTGRWVDGENLDRNRSTIRHKWAQVPVNPTDEMLRIKAACEAVARRRAGLVN